MAKKNNNLTEKTIKIKFKYTKDEYIRSRRKFLRKSKTISNGNLIFILLMTILEIVFLLIHEFFFLIIFGILLVLSYAMLYLLYIVNPKKQYDKTNFLKQEMEFEFNKQGIVSIIKNVKTKTNWDVIREIWENKEFIFLIQEEKMSYTVLPKRAFKNKYDLIDLQKLYLNGNEFGKYKNIK